MKVKILDQEFNDKNFWQMFDPKSALEYFIPTCEYWQSRGVVFTLEDTTIIDKYMRHIEIWAETQEESVLTELALRGFNK